MTEKNYPKLRFKGFTNAWVQRRLGNISEVRTGPFGSTLHAKDYVDDGTPIITTEHFKSGSLPAIKATIPQVSNEDFARLQSYVLHSGDIVFSRVGSVDKNSIVTSLQHGWLFSGRVLRVRTNCEISSEYIHSALSTERVRNDVVSRAVGQTMPSINTEILNETKLYLPLNHEEQTRIGCFFEKLDDLIAANQRKLEELKGIKKGYLQQIFERKIMFKGHSEPWEQRKLSERFTERLERSSEGQMISVTISSGVVQASSLERKDNSSFDKSGYKVVHVGDIAYNSMRMWQGASGVSPYNGILSPAYTVITPKSGVNSKFFSYQFKLVKMLQIFQRNSQGLTSDTWNLKFSQLKEIASFAPNIDGQREIVLFFKKIDDLIAANQIRLDHLKKLKKAYLQQMFV